MACPSASAAGAGAQPGADGVVGLEIAGAALQPIATHGRSYRGMRSLRTVERSEFQVEALGVVQWHAREPMVW
ncbi:hypothetical protein PPUN110474_35410 [Pseudomonas putida]|nr:hypothetical protein PPUN110474_35410 [Pseudomonas putida]